MPNSLHSPLAVRALDAGKHVLLEKPMATTVGEWDAVIDAAARSTGLVQMGFVCRCAATTLSAMEVIESGRLGRIYHAKATMYRRRGIPGLGRWFTTKSESGGGVLIDLGPHLVDLMLHLTGRPNVERVSASTSSRFGSPANAYRFTDMWAGPPNPDGVFNVDDGATAMLRCAGGLTLSLEAAWASHLPDGTIGDGVTLLGDQGAMHFDIWGDHLVIGTQLDEEIVDVKHPMAATEGWGTAFQREHQCFQRSCADTSGLYPNAEEGRAVQSVLEAMYRSAEGGCECAVSGDA